MRENGAANAGTKPEGHAEEYDPVSAAETPQNTTRGIPMGRARKAFVGMLQRTPTQILAGKPAKMLNVLSETSAISAGCVAEACDENCAGNGAGTAEATADGRKEKVGHTTTLFSLSSQAKYRR